MAISCVTSLNQVIIRKKKTYNNVKEYRINKNNNNLVCPSCGIHLDRKDIKIWNGYNCGECPCCYKMVNFDSINPRGPRGGREYYESKQTDMDLSPRVQDLSNKLETELDISNPLSYLKVEEISRFSHEDPEIVGSRCRNKWPIGRPSKEFQENRKKILDFLG